VVIRYFRHLVGFRRARKISNPIAYRPRNEMEQKTVVDFDIDRYMHWPSPEDTSRDDVPEEQPA
jgi:hypothetical protein